MRMRTPSPEPAWPASRLSVALLKPAAPRPQIRSLLAEQYDMLAERGRTLTAHDTRRLYPDAYGCDYIAARDTYLTADTVEILLLLARPGAPPPPKQVKTSIRAHLRVEDPLRNHLHMPDSPGEVYCDIAHLFGEAELSQFYGRYERERADQRLAVYRDVLAIR
jgi:hypothetical protein